MAKLTMDIFENVSNMGIIASGLAKDNNTGINMTGSGKLLKWVAQKYNNNEWRMFVGKFTQSTLNILTNGDTVSDMANVTRVLDCEDSVLELYGT